MTISNAPTLFKEKRRKFGKKKPEPAPEYSSVLYVQMEPQEVRLFRYLLEARDNLAYTSVIDRWASVLKLVFSPQQKEELIEHLSDMQASVNFKIVPFSES